MRRTGGRPTFAAGTFYPATPEEVRRSIRAFERAPAAAPAGPLFGGIVPHAGWTYSGAVAWTLFRRLADAAPRRIVLLGAVHVRGVACPSFGPWSEWEVPGASVAVDAVLQDALAARGVAALDRRAHVGEHSIEVQLPLLASALPDARVVPIAVPATGAAVDLGRALGDLLAEEGADGMSTCVVASSDLTHYGPEYYGFAPAGVGAPAFAWARANDERFLARVAALDARGVLDEARSHRNACGAGAVAAAIACVERLGAKRGEVLEHTSSLGAAGEEGARNFVGYAAVAFV